MCTEYKTSVDLRYNRLHETLQAVWVDSHPNPNSLVKLFKLFPRSYRLMDGHDLWKPQISWLFLYVCDHLFLNLCLHSLKMGFYPYISAHAPLIFASESNMLWHFIMCEGKWAWFSAVPAHHLRVTFFKHRNFRKTAPWAQAICITVRCQLTWERLNLCHEISSC